MVKSRSEKAAVTRDPTRLKRRKERNAETRLLLIEAAARVVGKHGYSGASIARITAEAGVAHGAFYLHFKSQQALFDMLLPHFGEEMIKSIGVAVGDARTLYEVESRGVHANFAFLEEHPELQRILREADAFAPEAYKNFIGILRERYFESLKRNLAAGAIKGFSENELDVVATILMGARDFLIERYTANDSGFGPLGEDVANVYLRFVLAGLTYADRIDLGADADAIAMNGSASEHAAAEPNSDEER